MSKYCSRFRGSPSHVVSLLLHLGLMIKNPELGKISAFSSDGNEATIKNENDAIEYLLGGNGISLWLDSDQNFFIFIHEQHLVGSFDGFTIEEQQNLVSRM